MDLEYYEISVPDRNDSIMRVNLDEVYYNLRLTWNAYGGFWMLSIYDAEMNIILGMARLVPDNLEFLLSNPRRPAGRPWR